jgi:hypothetical protein
MKKRLSSFLIILLLVTIWVYNADAAPNAKVVGRTYVNGKYGFQISLPDDLTKWSIQAKEEKVSVGDITATVFNIITGPSQAVVNVGVEETTYSLRSYFELTMAGCELLVRKWEKESTRVIVIGEEKLDGYELIATFSGIIGDVETEYKSIQWIAIRDKYAYVITGRDTSKNFDIDVFRKIMSTFKFLSIAVSEEKSTATMWGYIRNGL